jgi:hypothetical protein
LAIRNHGAPEVRKNLAKPLILRDISALAKIRGKTARESTQRRAPAATSRQILASRMRHLTLG